MYDRPPFAFRRSLLSRAGSCLLAAVLLSIAPAWAQSAISANGVVESKTGGFKFPDGSVQLTSATPSAASVEDSGQQTCWDAFGGPISCGGTGQDGEYQAGVDWPAPRFVDNDDGTVTDVLTGLIWLQDADCSTFGATVDFEDALSAANSLASSSCGLSDGSVAGDWRLPNVKELLSLVDYGESNPALPSAHPFVNVPSSGYWTSTSTSGYSPNAWTVNLLDGEAFGSNFKNKDSAVARVWPVRDAQ